MGCSVVSRWHRDGYTAKTREVGAIEDLEDVDAAQLLLLLDIEPSRGKHHEAGYAQAKGIPIIWWHWDADLTIKTMPIYSLHPSIINVWDWESLFIQMLIIEYPRVKYEGVEGVEEVEINLWKKNATL